MNNSKELRARAAKDIKWKPLTLILTAYLTASVIFTGLSMAAAKVNVIMSVMFSLFFVGVTVVVVPGILGSFLDAKRNKGISGPFGYAGRILPYLGTGILEVLMTEAVMLLGAIISASLIMATSIWPLGGVIFLVFMAGAVAVCLIYSQAKFFCIDGHGPVESLRKSRQAMSGNMGRYIMTILPVIGWTLLALVFISVMTVPTGLIVYIRGKYSLIGGIAALVLLAILAAVVLLPLVTYSLMICVEFYDDLTGRPSDANAGSKTPLAVVLISSAVLMIMASLLVMLPVRPVSVQESLQYLQKTEGSAAGNSISGLFRQEEPPAPPEPVERLGLKYMQPADYEESIYTDSVYYGKGEDRISIYRSLLSEAETDSGYLDYLEGYEGSEKIHGEDIDGYFYRGLNCMFIRDGELYSIYGTNETDMRALVRSILKYTGPKQPEKTEPDDDPAHK